jgi:CheY-like chemotaxis protein
VYTGEARGCKDIRSLVLVENLPRVNFVDVISIDIEMFVMDGFTCTTLIRDYERQGLMRAPAARQMGTRIPILAVSANMRSEQVK